MGRRERYHGDDAIVWEDNDSGKVMVKARIALPDKFDSFLQRENERAIKFRDG